MSSTLTTMGLRTSRVLFSTFVFLSLEASAQQSAPVSPDSSKPTIKVTTRLVVLNVVVNDKSGKPVAGLTKDDFQVLESNQRQTIAFFEPQIDSGFSYYTLSYYLTNQTWDFKFRPIRVVVVGRSGVTARTQLGYRVREEEIILQKTEVSGSLERRHQSVRPDEPPSQN